MVNNTAGDLIDYYADRHGWVIDWEHNTVRMPKGQSRYWYPIFRTINCITRFIRTYGGVLWCIALAWVVSTSAAEGRWAMALLSAVLFGARAEQQLHPKTKYSA